MSSALRYLLVRSFANGVRARLSRLRQPKYLVGLILGIAYFYFYFYQFLLGGRTGRGAMPQMIPGTLWPSVSAALLLVGTFVLSWILPASRAAIHFTEAEIAFLFPAPITRRRLVIHKLIKSQLTLLIFAVAITLLTGRFHAGPQAWFRMTGWWIILNTLNMHRMGASFALQRLRERGMADGKRRLLAVLALAAIVWGAMALWRALPSPPGVPPGTDPMTIAMGYAAQLFHHPVVSAVLTPFRLVVQPYFARDFVGFASALGPALGILLLHFLWVVRADVAFEEASIGAAQKRAALVTSIRRGEFRSKSAKAKTPAWPLAPTGFAPLAFLWKALLKFGGKRTLGFWSALFATLFFAAWFVRQNAGVKPSPAMITIMIVVGVVCYGAVLLSLVMVGQQASGQLRQAIGSFDLLKTYPLPGWQIALGELLGAVTLGTALQFGALSVSALMVSKLVMTDPRGLAILLVTGTSAALLLPAFNLAMSILPSAAALTFPGWFKPQDAATPGLENTGLRMLMGFFQLFAMAIALVPVAYFAGCVWLIGLRMGLDLEWRALSTVGVGALILFMEAAVGVEWLGKLYDRFDLTAERA